MKIFVITLKNANLRQEKIIEQFNQIGIEFEFFYGVDGRLPNVDFEYYSESKRLIRFGNKLSKTQLGCFASHYNMWRKCVELNQSIIVLEDDIFLSNDFVDKKSLVESALSTLQFLRLCGLTIDRKNTPVFDGVVRFLAGVSGTQGYAITPNTALKFIQHASFWLEPVDDYIDKVWVHGVPSYCILPRIVMPNDDEPSNMIRSEKQKIKFIYRVTRELYRFYSDIRRVIFNLHC